jgi:hypothetical protein
MPVKAAKVSTFLKSGYWTVTLPATAAAAVGFIFPMVTRLSQAIMRIMQKKRAAGHHGAHVMTSVVHIM